MLIFLSGLLHGTGRVGESRFVWIFTLIPKLDAFLTMLIDGESVKQFGTQGKVNAFAEHEFANVRNSLRLHTRPNLRSRERDGHGDFIGCVGVAQMHGLCPDAGEDGGLGGCGGIALRKAGRMGHEVNRPRSVTEQAARIAGREVVPENPHHDRNGLLAVAAFAQVHWSR